jgi:hypothetical protein
MLDFLNEFFGKYYDRQKLLNLLKTTVVDKSASAKHITDRGKKNLVMMRWFDLRLRLNQSSTFGFLVILIEPSGYLVNTSR